MTINPAAFFLPDPTFGQDIISLSKPICGMELIVNSHGAVKLGGFAQLRPGTTVQCCGDGFNERTIKVQANGRYYFVFLQDLESQADIPR